MLALGSNLKDREGNLRRAISSVAGRMRLTAVSSVYETEPMYREDQDWFLNCVVVTETDLEPAELLRWLKETEMKMGRDPLDARNAPRVIDMDILFWGDLVLSGHALEIPHPKLAERAFVLVPLNEVRPKLVHPVLKKSVGELLAGLSTDKGVFKRPGLLADLSPSPPPQPGRPVPSPERRAS